MSFRLLPNSLTLDDLERRNSLDLCVLSPNSVAFWAHYVKVEIYGYFLQQKGSTKN